MKLKKHIPNILSSTRLLSPFVLIPLILSNNYPMALVALACFLSTDAVDGYLARKWNAQSELGANIDALADKIILGSLVFPLVLQNPIMIINLVLEAVISFITVKRKLEGGNPKTLQVGRLKMIIISLFTGLGYLNNLVLVPRLINSIFFILTTIFQILAANGYYSEYKKEKKKRELKKIIKEIDNEKVNESKSSLEKDDCKDVVSQLEIKKEELINLKDELLSLKNNQNIEKEKVNVKKLV